LNLYTFTPYVFRLFGCSVLGCLGVWGAGPPVTWCRAAAIFAQARSGPVQGHGVSQRGTSALTAERGGGGGFTDNEIHFKLSLNRRHTASHTMDTLNSVRTLCVWWALQAATDV
jgi:hypothetical protein